MKHLYLTRKVLSALFLLLLAVGSVQAQFTKVNVDGNASAGEYGNANTAQPSVPERPNMTWFMTWDNTNLYIAIADVNNIIDKREGAVIYLDTNPIVPVNGGSQKDGSIRSYNNYDATGGILPFRADIVFYLRKDYTEYRKASGDGGWTLETKNFANVIYNNETNNGTREVAIPWSVMGGRPAAFNMLGYITAPTVGGGYIYGQIPQNTVLNQNGPGPIGTDAKFVRYYTISTTGDGHVNDTPGGPEGPFARESYANPDQNNSSFGPIDVYDFTANDPLGNSTQITRASGGNPVWNIRNNLVVGKNFSVFANTQAAINVGGKFIVNAGGKFYQNASPLTITGDFIVDESGSFAPGTASTSAVSLNGGPDQVIRVKNLTLPNLSLTGGDKILTSNLTINNNITLSEGARLITGNNSLILTGNTVNAPGAQLIEVLDRSASEDGGGYVLGTVESTEQITTGNRNYEFNNIGLTIRANGTTTPELPGSVTVQRLTGLTETAPGTGNPTSISRQYRLTTQNQNSVDVNFIFGYRDKQQNELNGIPENQLVLFRSAKFNQGPYQPLIGGTADPAANEVSIRTVVNLTGVFTLGDGLNPLPVELVAFTGKLEGSAVRLNWATASEKNNKGFEVQRQTGSDQWYTLGFVAGHGSTTQRNAYSYLDATALEGTAHYRLRQLDNDGTENFSTVVTVQVPAGNAPALVLSPVPTSDVLTISGLGAGSHVAEVFDMMGKRVLSHSFSSTQSTVSVANLPSGLYVVQVQGKKSKFVKQ